MLDEKIREFEKTRQGNSKTKKLIGIIGILLILIGVGVSFISLFAGLILIILGAILAASGFGALKSRSVKDFKDSVINDLLKEICSAECLYDKNGHISYKELKESHLFHMPDELRGEDLIVDTYKNVKYGVSDLELKEARRRLSPTGDTYIEYLTYFKGMFMIFDYPSDLKGELYILPRISNEIINLDTIESESIALNEKYKIYTTNKEYAFQILTPVVIEKILALNNIYKGIVSYAFTVDKLYIALNSRVNFLDLPEDKPVTEASIRKLESDLMLPQAIINEFQLDKGKFQR